MIIRTIAAVTLVSLSACGRASAPQNVNYEDQRYVDPITGQTTIMSVVTLGKLGVVANRDKPESFGIVNVRGKPIAGYTCEPDGSCLISVSDIKTGQVIVKTQPGGDGLKEITVYGPEWVTVDSNADGQSDTRTRHGSKTSQIWLDGVWVPIATTGSGKNHNRQYFVGDREVMLSAKGWVYSTVPRSR